MKNRVTVLIQGGIGNQLFTYACAYCIALQNGAELFLDLLPFESGYFRTYQLDRLNIKGKKVHHLLPKGIIYRIREWGLSHMFEYVREIKPYKYQCISSTKGNLYLEGYWQSEKYFRVARKELLNTFYPVAPDDRNMIDSFCDKYVKKNTVAVHIRRGDFVTGKTSISAEFYHRAFEWINATIDDPEYIFFSDDIEYVKKVFGTENIKMYLFTDISDINDDLLTLFCMSRCPNMIIANSSFSWWAAWLNDNDKKNIIAPCPAYLMNSDYYPEDWNVIETNCGE